MIIPSIDLVNGNAVQLVGGEAQAIDAGDPFPIAEKFSRVGEIAVIDIDAARGEGDNAETIRALADRYDIRVGGGIRDYDAAVRCLDAGAAKIIIGTAAERSLLSRLPKERVIVAVDARDGVVVDQGWRNTTGFNALQRIRDLRDVTGGFLVTFVEVEGRMAGLPLDRVQDVVSAAGDAQVTVAGGVKNAQEIGQADQLSADTQVGMALYSGAITLAEGFAASLTTDRPDGLWPTVVADERGVALGLVYSNLRSLSRAIESGKGVYWSRSRDGVWEKGATSGATQQLIRIDADCDRDALRFTVRQTGAFCHEGTRSCWGADRALGAVAERLAERAASADAGSYTRRLLDDPALLAAKLTEEAGELAEAATADEIEWEAADVLYFTLVAMTRAGVDLAAVERHLARRMRAVTRRSATETAT